MVWQRKQFSDNILLLAKMWKYLALSEYHFIYSRKLHSRLCISKQSKLWIVTCCFICIDLFVYFYLFQNTTSLHDFSSHLQFIFMSIQSLGTILFMNIRHKNIANIFTNIMLIEDYLELTKSDIAMVTQKYLIKYFVAKTIYAFVIFYCDLAYMIGSERDLIFSLCFFIQWIFHPVLEVSLLFFVFTIRDFYIECIKILKHNFSSLDQAYLIQNMLQNLSTNTNLALNLVLTIKFLPDFLFLANDVYFGTSTLPPLATNLLSNLVIKTATGSWILAIIYFDKMFLSCVENIIEENSKLVRIIEETVKHFNYNIRLS